MKTALRLSFLLVLLSGLLAAQTKLVPTCNNFDATGAPVYVDPTSTSGTPVTPCTDFFGVGNWANSPLPAGTITGFTLISGGDGYVNPVVVITDPTGGTGASATATADLTGALTAITGGGGSGYIMPQVTIVDVGAGGTLGGVTCGGTGQPACGSGAMATAIIGGPFTGRRKIGDALPELKGGTATPTKTKT